jgi:DNA repair protein RadA/Sms
MAKSSKKEVFVCRECGKESTKWLGRCPDCQAWNSFSQMTLNTTKAPTFRPTGTAAFPQELSEVEIKTADRSPLPLAEFNRVLGGGLIAGSLVLISGDPGIGKSTLLLQAAAAWANEKRRVVYVTGEETAAQIKIRADRLGLKGGGLFVLSETALDAVLEHAEQSKPSLLVVDSIQTVYIPEVESAAGSVTQVRDCTMRLMQWAKTTGVPVFITGQGRHHRRAAYPRTHCRCCFIPGRRGFQRLPAAPLR